ncbi:hypothetical protein [Devosia ginsengisoli]|uniref:Uncharacterized protein n=1 Tax=Devosia ginsengisoli TaxID=400770 RepID=A0A5B8LS17_9HYPH|nr:hypothetical protein [Devosia ginsengisoli]QDZ10535.1 hypothetical protein FPZ08_07090 [Devosia ginsengisoli]
MTTQDQAFYSSENGDQWLLVGRGTEHAKVRHQPNASSGGQVRDVALKDFLSREQNTPQGVALRHLMDDEAEEPRSGRP